MGKLASDMYTFVYILPRLQIILLHVSSSAADYLSHFQKWNILVH
jgi:hypothetical protein